MSALPDYLESRIERVPFSSCWYWTGSVSPYGYGSVYDRLIGQRQQAHRAVYRAAVAEPPQGLDLDHLCRVRCCVNPAHLEPVTRGENTRRGLLPTVLREKYLAEVTRCINGHAYSPENTYWRPTGGRGCVVCRAARSRESEARRAERRRAESRAAVDQGRRTAWRKLSDEDVAAIRELLRTSGLTQRDIAARYGISNVTVSAIKTRGYREQS
jgi:hypothetical protein